MQKYTAKNEKSLKYPWITKIYTKEKTWSILYVIYNVSVRNSIGRVAKKSDKRTDTPTNILQKLISQP